jgi:hypothetical protein
VTAVTGVIAVSAVIAGIVLLGPVRAAPHGGQGSRASRDLRAGRDRRDPSRLSRPHGGHGPTAAAVIAWGRAPPRLRVGCDSEYPPRSSRHHGGHGHTAGAVIAVTAAGAARRARRARRVGCDKQDPARPLKGGPGLIGCDARNRGFSRRGGLSRRGLRWPRHSTKMFDGREPRCRPWGPRRSRRQDRALEAAGDRNSKCF